mgnify:CR=1 FL=1
MGVRMQCGLGPWRRSRCRTKPGWLRQVPVPAGTAGESARKRGRSIVVSQNARPKVGPGVLARTCRMYARDGRTHFTTHHPRPTTHARVPSVLSVSSLFNCRSLHDQPPTIHDSSVLCGELSSSLCELRRGGARTDIHRTRTPRGISPQSSQRAQRKRGTYQSRSGRLARTCQSGSGRPRTDIRNVRPGTVVPTSPGRPSVLSVSSLFTCRSTIRRLTTPLCPLCSLW